MPGDSVNKILIVENIGTEDTSYNIVWKDLINQINYFDLHLDMKCKSYKNYGKSNQEEYGECKSFYKAVPYTETKIKKDIKRDIEIEVGVTQVYELTITFLNRNYSQDENLNRSFSGRIELEDYIDNSPEAIYCNYDGEMVQGAEYINGQYTYRYMQEYNNSTSGYNWTNIKDNGWGVVLTDKESTEPVTSKLCTYINNIPVVSMLNMFSESQTSSIDLSSFDTSKVIDMNRLFSAHTYIYGYEKLNTGQATDMCGMFTGVLNENLDLSSFDTSKVTDMKEMFSSVKTKNINVSSFNTSNVTDMSRMFAWNDNIMLDLRSFDLNDNVDLTGMFTNSKSIIGYAKNETIVSKFNDSSVTGIPSTLKFIVKQN